VSEVADTKLAEAGEQVRGEEKRTPLHKEK